MLLPFRRLGDDYSPDGGSIAHVLDMTSSAALQMRRDLAASSILAAWRRHLVAPPEARSAAGLQQRQGDCRCGKDGGKD
jgi:hypothetical protein